MRISVTLILTQEPPFAGDVRTKWTILMDAPPRVGETIFLDRIPTGALLHVAAVQHLIIQGEHTMQCEVHL